jgi:hypothetical protein
MQDPRAGLLSSEGPTRRDGSWLRWSSGTGDGSSSSRSGRGEEVLSLPPHWAREIPQRRLKFFNRPSSPAAASVVESLREMDDLHLALAAATTATVSVNANSFRGCPPTAECALELGWPRRSAQPNSASSAGLGAASDPARGHAASNPAHGYNASDSAGGDVLKAFKCFLPNLPRNSGDDAPDAFKFLTQLCTYVHHLGIPPVLIPRQLIVKPSG